MMWRPVRENAWSFAAPVGHAWASCSSYERPREALTQHPEQLDRWLDRIHRDALRGVELKRDELLQSVYSDRHVVGGKPGTIR